MKQLHRRKGPSLFVAALFALAMFAAFPALVVRAAPVDIQPTMTFTEIKNVIESAGNGDVVTFAAGAYEFNENQAIEIATGVTVQGATGGITISRGGSQTGQPLFRVKNGGTLTLSSIVLDGNGTAATAPLVEVQSGGTLVLTGSGSTAAVLKNGLNTGGQGGAVYTAGTLRMEGGEMQNCTAGVANTTQGLGGGVFVAAGGSLSVSGTASITGCKALGAAQPGRGGGVYVQAGATLTLAGGSLAQNQAQDKNGAAGGLGGGAYVGGRLELSGGSVKGNTAQNGKALYLDSGAAANLSGAPLIGETNGGGLAWASAASPLTITSAGLAAGAQLFLESPATPADGYVLATRSGAAATATDAAAFKHPGSSLPIQVSGQNAAQIIFSAPKYTIRYEANGDNVSGLPAETQLTAGASYAVPTAVPTRTGYTFTLYNTAANGGGTSYVPGQAFAANGHLTLYAQWAPAPVPPASSEPPVRYRVTYDVNHSNLGTSQIHDQTGFAPNDTVTVRDTKPTRIGYTFTGWNTRADGKGTPYKGGDTFIINSNTPLYAQWAAVPASSSSSSSSTPSSSSSSSSSQNSSSSPSSATAPSSTPPPSSSQAPPPSSTGGQSLPDESAPAAPAPGLGTQAIVWLIVLGVLLVAATALLVVVLARRRQR